MIRDVEKVGIGDRTGPLPAMLDLHVTGTRSLKAPGDLLALWAIQKSAETARLELYVSWALRAARAGELEAAREVALETLGFLKHESWERQLAVVAESGQARFEGCEEPRP